MLIVLMTSRMVMDEEGARRKAAEPDANPQGFRRKTGNSKDDSNSRASISGLHELPGSFKENRSNVFERAKTLIPLLDFTL